jgi:hypothetical protein
MRRGGQADRERIIALQDRLIEQRRKERMIAQQRGDAAKRRTDDAGAHRCSRDGW